jgi:hypothetical protein
MTPLTTVADAATAQILVAHLGAAGVTWELRGNHSGPYPVGPVEILVAEADLDLARALLTEAEDDVSADGEEGLAPGPATDRAPLALWAVVAVVLLVSLVLLGRLITMAP